MPTNRGFDAFYGLPYSVDDGIGYASNCPNANGRVHGVGNILPTERQGNVSKIQLGPEIPLPLVQQSPNEQGYGTRDVPGVGADLARAAYANTPFRQASFAAGGRVTQTRDAAQYNSLVVLSIKYTKRRLNGSTARD